MDKVYFFYIYILRCHKWSRWLLIWEKKRILKSTYMFFFFKFSLIWKIHKKYQNVGRKTY